MRFFRFLSDPQRWSWFAAGDESAPTRMLLNAPSHENSTERVVWEIGWVIAIPLAIAALVQLVLGAFAQ